MNREAGEQGDHISPRMLQLLEKGRSQARGGPGPHPLRGSIQIEAVHELIKRAKEKKRAELPDSEVLDSEDIEEIEIEELKENLALWSPGEQDSTDMDNADKSFDPRSPSPYHRGLLYDKPTRGTRTYVLNAETAEVVEVKKKKRKKSVWNFDNMEDN